MQITLEFKDAAKLEVALKAVVCDAARQSVAHAAATELKRMTEQNFRSETYRAAAWPPLAKSTAGGMSAPRKRAAKKRKGGAAKPLIDTATLMRSFSVERGVEGAALITTQDYANYHQFGTVKMPARPIVPVTGEYGGEATPTPKAEKALQRAANAALRVVIAKAGL